MKTIALILATLLFTITSAVSQETNADRYILYPTKNMWTFLKLDTSNGKIWQVQYSVKGEDYRFESKLNNIGLITEENGITGRFKLYPTENMYNFILVDTKVGTTYQVQWSTKPGKRMILPISSDHVLVWSKVEKDEKYNYINRTGYYLLDKWYDEIHICDNSGYIWVKENNKENLFSSNGEIILPEWYDEIHICDNSDIIWVKENNKENLFSSNGEIILPEWYDKCDYDNKSGYIRVGQNGKYNILDRSGNFLFVDWFEYIYFPNDEKTEYFKISNGNKYNYITIKGRIVLDKWYSKCGNISNDMIPIYENGIWNFADAKTGRPISRE